MTVGQKASLSLLVSVLIFAAFAVAAFSGLFNVVEARFYNPSVSRAWEKVLDKAAAASDTWHEGNLERFRKALDYDYVKRSFLPNASTEDAFKRSTTFGKLQENSPGLVGYRFVDSAGKRIHFSNLPGDILKQSPTEILYRLYGDASDLAYDSIASPEPAPGASQGKIFLDPAQRQFIYSLPFIDGFGVYRGTAFFLVSQTGLASSLLGQGILKVGDEAVFAGKEGIVLKAPLDSRDLIVARIADIWKAVPSAGPEPIIEGSASGLVLFSRTTALGGKLGLLVAQSEFAFPAAMKWLLLAVFFVTAYLLSFLLLNLRQDRMTVLSDRIKRFQINLLEGYIDNKADIDFERWSRELEARRGEVKEEFKRSLGRRRRGADSSVDSLIDKSWDEIIAILGKRAGPEALPSGLDIKEVERLITAALKGGTFVLPVQEAPRPVAPPREEALVQARPVPVPVQVQTPAFQPGEDIEDLEDAEAVEEAVEEAESAEDFEELEEVDLPEAAARPEPVQPVQPAPPVEVAQAPEEFGDLEDLEDLEEVPEAEEVSAAEEASAAEETTPAEEVPEAEEAPFPTMVLARPPLMPASAEEAPQAQVEAPAKAEDYEDLEELEAVEDLEEAEPALEPAAAPEPLAKPIAGPAPERPSPQAPIVLARPRAPAAEPVPEAEEVEELEELESLDEGGDDVFGEEVTAYGDLRAAAAQALALATDDDDVPLIPESSGLELADEADIGDLVGFVEADEGESSDYLDLASPGEGYSDVEELGDEFGDLEEVSEAEDLGEDLGPGPRPEARPAPQEMMDDIPETGKPIHIIPETIHEQESLLNLSLDLGSLDLSSLEGSSMEAWEDGPAGAQEMDATRESHPAPVESHMAAPEPEPEPDDAEFSLVPPEISEILEALPEAEDSREEPDSEATEVEELPGIFNPYHRPMGGAYAFSAMPALEDLPVFDEDPEGASPEEVLSVDDVQGGLGPEIEDDEDEAPMPQDGPIVFKDGVFFLQEGPEGSPGESSLDPELKGLIDSVLSHPLDEAPRLD